MVKQKAPADPVPTERDPVGGRDARLLIIFMVITPMLSKGVSVDMVMTDNPIAMYDADREDAVFVAVTRDGKVYLGSTPVNRRGSPAKVRDMLANRSGQDGLSQG